MRKVIVVTPHPDDETLGCGGTILKHKSAGDRIYWLIITEMDGNSFSSEKIKKRNLEIDRVSELYGFDEVIRLPYLPARLDEVPISELVNKIGQVFMKFKPTIVYSPYRGDIHSDHKFVHDATMACTKWFRYPSIEKVYLYETLSETDFNMNVDTNGFRPNVFINIDSYIDKKIDIMNVYCSEIDSHPFPRSEESIRALAILRGAAAGYNAAEAFMLVKERVL